MSNSIDKLCKLALFKYYQIVHDYTYQNFVLKRIYHCSSKIFPYVSQQANQTYARNTENDPVKYNLLFEKSFKFGLLPQGVSIKNLQICSFESIEESLQMRIIYDNQFQFQVQNAYSKDNQNPKHLCSEEFTKLHCN